MNGTSLMMEDMENDLIVQENRSPGRARQQSKKFDLRRISKSIIISKSKRRMLYILLATAVMLFLVAGGTTAIVVVNDDDTTDASHAQAAQGADTADSYAAAANVNHNPNKVNAVMDEQQANNDVEGDDEDQADVADEENDDDADAQEDNDGKQNEPDEPEDVDNGPDLEALIAAHLESDGMASNGVKAVSDFIHKTYSDVDVDYFEGDRWKTRLQKPQDVAFSSPVNIFWNVKTNMGALKFQLRPDYARYHCANTVYLSLLGFYDNTIWHRIIPQFMGQFGDPTGTGGGSPGYRYSGEFNKSPEAKHDGRGVLSTANAGPGTDGSQVFVLFAEARHLNGKHTVFGRMVSGDDTLDKIEKVGSRSGAPSKEVLLEKAWISVELPY